jgi:hypothetical protein
MRSSRGTPVHVRWSLCGAAAAPRVPEAGHPSRAGRPSQLVGRRVPCGAGPGQWNVLARPRDSPSRGPRRLFAWPAGGCSRGPRARGRGVNPSTDHGSHA